MDLLSIRDEIRQVVKLTQYMGTSKRIDCPELYCDGKGKKADCQVYEDSYYCFVCKTRGDIFTWVMLSQSCNFGTAIRILADYAGIALEPHPERSSLLNVFLSESINYLKNHPKKLEYLTNRGIDLDTITNHKIGYCDMEGEVLESSGLTNEQLLHLGLVYPYQTGYISSLEGRFVFPIKDQLGRVISIKGRANPIDQPNLDPRRKSMPIKAEGPWGRHSHMDYLYLEDLITQYEDYVFICEGEPDTLTLRSWGINALGMMTNTGIAKHAHKLKSFKRIYFVLDNDANTQRHLVTELYNLQVKLPDVTIFNVTLPNHPDGKKLDVNDYKCLGNSKLDFHRLSTASPEATDVIVREWAASLLVSKDRAISSKLYNLIRCMPSQKEKLVNLVAELTGVTIETLLFAVETCN